MHIPRTLFPLLVLSALVLIPPVLSQTALSVTASTNKTQYSTGETVSISGAVHDSQSTALSGVTVSIQVNGPGNKLVHVQLVYSDQSGGYSDSFLLPAASDAGQYTVFISATKSGYNNGQVQTQFSVSISSTTTSTSQTTSTSSSSTATVPLPKCLIATAAYGSELAPEVTLLRNFRDQEILRTSAGDSFMQVFNAFYYSFSPQVASYISTNNDLRTVTRIILSPLVGILYLSNIVFTASSFNRELAATLTGIFASIGLGAVYLGPITTAASHFFNSRRSFRHVRLIQVTGVMVIVFLMGIFLAEASQMTALLTVATVGTVLSSIALGGLLVPSIGARAVKYVKELSQ